MKKSNKLVFFGNERLATGLNATEPTTLKSLIENGYEVAAVVSNYTKGNSRNSRELEIAQVAKTYNIPLLLPNNLSGIAGQLQSFGATAAVLVAYGKIIPANIIDIFPRGIINIHPSLLPKYRGPTPIERAILDGAAQTGVSLMQLTPKMDAGGVFVQRKVKLTISESKEQLAKLLLNLGSELLLENLPSILDGSLQPQPQDDTQASYTALLKKEDGVIDWSKPTHVIERQIRAYFGFPKSRTNIFGHEVVITRTRVAKDETDGDLVMKCTPGWLEIQELTAPSGRGITGAEFLRGYKK